MKKLVVAALMAGLAAQTASTQMLSYASGQNVSPGFEGWEKNADGSFNMMFGYMNRNWEEEPVVPVGPDNCISPGPCDQAQPTLSGRTNARTGDSGTRAPKPPGWWKRNAGLRSN